MLSSCPNTDQVHGYSDCFPIYISVYPSSEASLKLVWCVSSCHLDNYSNTSKEKRELEMQKKKIGNRRDMTSG